jgi:hypothetical protein
LREHLRLLLAVTAEEFAAGMGDNEESALVAKSIARDPNHFLRALDQLGAAGWAFEEIDSPPLREIAARFEKQARDCGFTFVYEADRAAVRGAEKSGALFSNLLLFGFDASHWPLWPLLRAATLVSEDATVVLNDPRDEAREVDETWVGTWPRSFHPHLPLRDFLSLARERMEVRVGRTQSLSRCQLKFISPSVATQLSRRAQLSR